MVVAVSSHKSAIFQGGCGHLCGRVARLATRQGLLHLSSPPRLGRWAGNMQKATRQRDRDLYLQPTGLGPLDYRDDCSRPALRHGSLNFPFRGSLTSTFLDGLKRCRRQPGNQKGQPRLAVYRGTSLIKKRPSPCDPPRTLGIGLRQDPKGNAFSCK